MSKFHSGYIGPITNLLKITDKIILVLIAGCVYFLRSTYFLLKM